AAPRAVTVVSAWTSTATGSLRVSFTPGATNGSPITSFAATCTSTNGGITRTASGTASPIAVASLTTGKAYTCAVKATNARGVGAASTSSAPVVGGAPSGVSAPTG